MYRQVRSLPRAIDGEKSQVNKVNPAKVAVDMAKQLAAYFVLAYGLIG